MKKNLYSIMHPDSCKCNNINVKDGYLPVFMSRFQRRTCSTAGFFMKTPCMPRCVDVRSWRKMLASTWLTTMRRSLFPYLTLEAATPLILSTTFTG